MLFTTKERASEPGVADLEFLCEFLQIKLCSDLCVHEVDCFIDFQPVDRLPAWEWAMWWDKTIERWHGEGLPAGKTGIFDIHEYFGLDPYIQFWFSTTDPTIEATQHHVEGIVSNMDEYVVKGTK